MPVTEFDVKSLVLRMLDDVNKPGNSNFNNYWWNYVSPSKQADFVHVDSVGRFYVGREQVEAAFNGAGWSPLRVDLHPMIHFLFSSQTRTSPSGLNF